MTEKLNNYQIAARIRAEKIKTFDPMFYRRNGKKGGSAKVPKGFAMMDPQDLKVVSAKGGSNAKKSN